MSHIRSSMILLGICVLALGIGVLRLATERTPLPVGSSYSTEPNGAQALYEWLDVMGASSSRLQEAVVDDTAPPSSLLVLQPESVVDPTARQAFDTVPSHGGTLIVAGDSLPWLLYVRDLGVSVEPISATSRARTPEDSITLNALVRYRIRAQDATPLLEGESGDWLALRKPYLQGTLIVLASADPLLNRSLENDSTARFVYRAIVSHAMPTVAFDEAHHSFVPPDAAGAPVTVDRLLFNTAPGRAVVYATVVVFIFLVLTGRRLGPAVTGRDATETRRTMYEHVQMLANLYRRAGQVGALRTGFARHYRRLSVTRRDSARFAEALARIETARNESDLLAAVATASTDE